MIFFRTDGNKQIATGHMMRCLAIAQACVDMGDTCFNMDKVLAYFLVSDEESKSLLLDILEREKSIHGLSIRVQVLDSADYRQPEKELRELTAILRENKPILFLDSYFVTPLYLNALAKVARVVYLDDLQAFDYPVDMVINYDVIPLDMLPAYEAAYSKAKKRLLGPIFTPLRKQFVTTARKQKQCLMENPKASSKANLKLLISTGGSDPYHTAKHLLEYLFIEFDNLLKEFSIDSEYHVIVGQMSEDKDELKRLAACSSNVILHEQVSNMALLMSSCDLAISAAGTTLYELCALGIPTASYVLADNQLACAKAFDAVDAIPFLGDVRVEENQVFSAFLSFLKSMLDTDNRQNATACMQQLVDGLGAERIAKEILALSC